MIGATYSTEHYREFKKTGNQNIFEEIIDMMVLDGIEGMNDSFRKAISNLPTKEKRMAILSILDKDLNLFRKIKSIISDEKLSKIDHLKDVILMLREYVKVGPEERKKFGEVMTDLNLVKHILSRIPEEDFKDHTKTFIDLANGTGVFPLIVIYRLMKGLEEWEPDPEKRYKHIVENQIYVSEIQPKNMFLYLCLIDPYDEYDLNIYCGSSLDDGFRKHMKEVWNKEGKNCFTYSIGNPPFNQMIDMKFVKLSYEIAEKTCIVHPSTWLLDEKGKQKAFLSTKELIKDHLDNIELFNGNGIFGISLFVPCVITYIDKNKKHTGIKCIDRINKKEITYLKIDDINKFSDNEIYKSIKCKILNYSKKNNLLDKIGNNNGSFFVNIPQIRGDVRGRNKKGLSMEEKMSADSFYTIVSKDYNIEKEPKQQSFSFINENEAINFLNYIKTDFARFCISIYKNNQNQHRGELAAIPWFDFKEEWTDNKLFSLFKLSESEVSFIKNNIPEFYKKKVDTLIEYDNIYQINKYSNLNEYISIKNKIKKISTQNNLLNFKNKINGRYFINTAQIRGHVDLKNDSMLKDDFYTFVTKDLKVENEKKKHMFFSFKTKSEAENFLIYLKTNFSRFCLSILKSNSQLDRGELEIVPWLDFSQEWTDDKLYKEFNLTEDEIKFIEKHIPKYY